jgi:hypothetical protein
VAQQCGVPDTTALLSSGGLADSPVAERIVYASQAAIDGSVYAEMERIRASALLHNEPVGVTTALLYQSGWFVQWKEGPIAAIRELMARVERDTRHHSLRIVHASRGRRLLDGPWSMGIVQCGEDPADMAARVDLLRHDVEQGRRYTPPAVWRQLSTPLSHPGYRRQADPDAFQRVLLCAARGTGSFSIVSWLAAANGQQVVHRRFAGPRDLDVGTDYADILCGDRVLRVIAMARRGLSLPITRAFLPDYSHILLLLSGDPAADVGLLRRIAGAVAGLPSVPEVVGIGTSAAQQQALVALATQLGLAYRAVVSPDMAPSVVWQAAQPSLAGWRDDAHTAADEANASTAHACAG